VRVFLDTNVLVGAFVTRGLCADVLEIVLTEHELVVGEVVLVELRRVLLEKIAAEPSLVERTDLLLRGQSRVEPKPEAHLSLGLRDPDDEWVVASAISGEADILVTGDADLLDEQERMPITTVSPRQSWGLLRGSGGGM
jgi:putative PIN family toxin of toxin-antitoxin system